MQPIFDIYFVRGKEQATKLNASSKVYVTSIVTALTDYGIDTCEIEFDFGNQTILADYLLDKSSAVEGNSILIDMGYVEYGIGTTFTGVITGIHAQFGETILVKLVAMDFSVRLNSKVIDVDALNVIAEKFDPIQVAKDIINDVEEKGGTADYNNPNIPNFGLKFTQNTADIEIENDSDVNYTKVSIPNWTNEEKSNKRMVAVTDPISKQTTWGMSNDSGTDKENWAKSLEGGFQVTSKDTYAGLLNLLGSITNRLFWYDSRDNKAYFKKPIVNTKPLIEYVYGMSRMVQPLQQILSFKPNQSMVDLIWTTTGTTVVQGREGENVTLTAIKEQDSDVTSDTVKVTNNPKNVSAVTKNLPVALQMLAGGNSEISVTPKAPGEVEIKMGKKHSMMGREYTVEGELLLHGDVFLRPRMAIKLTNVTSRFEGLWVIAHVTHSITTDGYYCKCVVKRNVITIPKTWDDKVKAETKTIEKVADAAGKDNNIAVEAHSEPTHLNAPILLEETMDEWFIKRGMTPVGLINE